MTDLLVLGSGSKGNCLAIRHDGAVLLVDAGFSAREIGKRAESAGLDLRAVVGIVLTHEHGDHTGGARILSRKLAVPILSSGGTWARLGLEDTAHLPLRAATPTPLGPFVVEACPTSHDAAEPIAVAVRIGTGVGVGVAYDLGRATAAVRYLLRKLTALVLEANHDELSLRTSAYPPSVQERIAGSAGHLSNRAAAELLAGLVHPGLQHVVLAHLSEQCNTADAALAVVGPALRRVGYAGGLHVATQGEPLPTLPLRPRQLVLEL